MHCCQISCFSAKPKRNPAENYYFYIFKLLMTTLFSFVLVLKALSRKWAKRISWVGKFFSLVAWEIIIIKNKRAFLIFFSFCPVLNCYFAGDCVWHSFSIIHEVEFLCGNKETDLRNEKLFSRIIKRRSILNSKDWKQDFLKIQIFLQKTW